MKITKNKDNLIIKIPLKQKSYDAINEYIGDVDNVIGVVIENDPSNETFEQGIYQLNELGYKDDIQLGMPLIKTYMDNDEFRKLCDRLLIDVWSYNKCAFESCREILYGTHTINGKGEPVCLEHEESLGRI